MTKLRLLGKKRSIGGISAGIAALDIIDAEFVEHLRDQLLVMQREIDAVGLRAVAQRGVEQIKAFAAHDGAPGAAFSASVFCIVVLASHSPLIVTVLRCMATYPRFRNRGSELSLASTVRLFAPRAPASFSS